MVHKHKFEMLNKVSRKHDGHFKSFTSQLVYMKYLLPELSDGGCEVSGICSHPECLVLAEGVLHAIGCVPFVIAACPGELWLKALEQVVQAPGQDHDVVDVQQRNDHNGCIADTCAKKSEVAILSVTF